MAVICYELLKETILAAIIFLASSHLASYNVQVTATFCVLNFLWHAQLLYSFKAGAAFK